MRALAAAAATGPLLLQRSTWTLRPPEIRHRHLPCHASSIGMRVGIRVGHRRWFGKVATVDTPASKFFRHMYFATRRGMRCAQLLQRRIS